MHVITSSQWNPRTGILRTDLTGPVTIEDVAKWRFELEYSVRQLAEFTDFRLLLNLHGFEPVSMGAHLAMRAVVPELQAAHGMRPAFVDLFELPQSITVRLERGVRCVAFANVHHDAAMMASYENRIGRYNQRFFTDLATAEFWLRHVA